MARWGDWTWEGPEIAVRDWGESVRVIETSALTWDHLIAHLWDAVALWAALVAYRELFLDIHVEEGGHPFDEWPSPPYGLRPEDP